MRRLRKIASRIFHKKPGAGKARQKGRQDMFEEMDRRHRETAPDFGTIHKKLAGIKKGQKIKIAVDTGFGRETQHSGRIRYVEYKTRLLITEKGKKISIPIRDIKKINGKNV